MTELNVDIMVLLPNYSQSQVVRTEQNLEDHLGRCIW